MSTFLHLVAPVLARQHSLITARQIKDVGGHHEAARRLVERGIWERLDTMLFGPTGVSMYWRRKVMAALLVAPAGALASHRAAAHLLGTGGLEDPAPEITIPRGTSLRRKGVIVHESVDLDLAQRCVVDGIPTTGPHRLAVDLGAVVSPARYIHTVRELRHGMGVTSEQLLRTYLRHKERGRNGCGPLRDWLDRYFDVAGVPESGLEQLVLDAILDAGLPAPVLQHWVVTATGNYRLDIAYPERLTVLEVNGRQHADPDVSVNDAVRTDALEALGWEVLVIESDRLASDLTAVLRRLREIHGSVV